MLAAFSESKQKKCKRVILKKIIESMAPIIIAEKESNKMK